MFIKFQEFWYPPYRFLIDLQKYISFKLGNMTHVFHHIWTSIQHRCGGYQRTRHFVKQISVPIKIALLPSSEGKCRTNNIQTYPTTFPKTIFQMSLSKADFFTVVDHYLLIVVGGPDPYWGVHLTINTEVLRRSWITNIRSDGDQDGRARKGIWS